MSRFAAQCSNNVACKSRRTQRIEYFSVLVVELWLVFSLMKLICCCVSLTVCFAFTATEGGGNAYAGFGRKSFEALHLSEGNRALIFFFLCEWLDSK